MSSRTAWTMEWKLAEEKKWMARKQNNLCLLQNEPGLTGEFEVKNGEEVPH